jgi:hypothetical protein
VFFQFAIKIAKTALGPLPENNRLERKADHPPTSSAQVKNAPVSPMLFYDMVLRTGKMYQYSLVT